MLAIELALWITIGLLLTVVGYTINDWQWWCLLGTYWAVNSLSRARGRVEGMIDYIDMTKQEQQRVRDAVREAREEQQ